MKTELSFRDALICIALMLVGYGFIRVAVVVERLEPQVKQGLDDFHHVKEQIEPFRQTVDKAGIAIEKLTPFRDGGRR